MAKDLCKLTGTLGKYVDAHLIPKALTRPEKKGAPFVQWLPDAPPVRRWSSWYDPRLVTRAGEDIFTRLDTWAISELRKQRLVWSGWGPMKILTDGHIPIGESGWGFRAVECADADRLRLFFHSLLWRAAATVRPEFSEVAMPPDDLEALRLTLVNDNVAPLAFYPISLIQLSTIGTIHNLPPIAQTKIIPAVDEGEQQEVPVFRFYFDGLIAHVHRQASDDGHAKELGPLVVGGEKKLVISTVTYENSFERSNLEFYMFQAFIKWPEAMAKL